MFDRHGNVVSAKYLCRYAVAENWKSDPRQRPLGKETEVGSRNRYQQ